MFIPWVAFLIQDTAEWKPCVVNTQCGRCYRQITRCYSQTYNKNPCQVPRTVQALYICYLIYPSQPTKSRHLRQHPDFTNEQPEMENISVPPRGPRVRRGRVRGPLRGSLQGDPIPAHPVSPPLWWSGSFFPFMAKHSASLHSVFHKEARVLSKKIPELQPLNVFSMVSSI